MKTAIPCPYAWALVLAALVALACNAPSAYSQAYTFSNFAGEPGGPGHIDATRTAARFNIPNDTVADSAGNVYAADNYNHVIRKITPAGVVTTFAGAGFAGSNNGVGADAQFSFPSYLAIDSAGNLYVADSNNHTIRKISPAAVVTTLAGSPGQSGSSDGTGATARFNEPRGLACDTARNVYVADGYNHTIRKVTPSGEVSTLAGSAGNPGFADGLGAAATFSSPTGVAVDSLGNVYVVDGAIRKITPDGLVTTLVGNTGQFIGHEDLTIDYLDNLYVIDTDFTTSGGRIRKVTTAGVVSTVAGSTGTSGSSDGTGSAAKFNGPQGIGMAASGTGALYVADSYNHTIRRATTAGVVTTLAGTAPHVGSIDGTGAAARFGGPNDVAVDPNANVFIVDAFNQTIRKASVAGVVTTFAGTAGILGSNNGTGASASFTLPQTLAVDANGNIYVGEPFSVRKITPSRVVTSLAGGPVNFVGVSPNEGSADGTGVAAQFGFVEGLAADASGNVYVADSENHTIRKVTSAGVVTTLAGSAGAAGNVDGQGTSARFSNPTGVACDSAGNIYVADYHNHTIRKVTPQGAVTTLAGLAGNSGYTDGTGSAARFYNPNDLSLDSAGNIYVVQTDNSANAIRKVTPTGVVTTIQTTAGYHNNVGDGTGFNGPFKRGITVTAAGLIYVSDRENNRILKGTKPTVAAPEIVVQQPADTELTSGTASIDFGSQIVGSSNLLTFTIKNTGTASLTGLAITKSGTNSTDFVMGNLGATSIAMGSSRDFAVTFTPTADGSRSAMISIASNDGDENPFTIAVSGMGIPAIGLAPTATTGVASGISPTTANLAGSVDPKGGTTTVVFEYGLNNSYSSTVTAPSSPLMGSGAQAVIGSLTGLLGHQLYHYRVKASSGGGVANGADKTFTTLNTLPVASTDTDTALPGGVLTLDVLGNDTDADGDTRTLTAIKTFPPASAGSAKVVGSNIVFTAAATFAGTSFTYTVSDGFGGTATGTVNVALEACAISPVATSVAAAATSYPVTVTTAGAWMVTESLSWASVDSSWGTGNGSVTVTLLANATKIARTGVITIGGQAHTIVQAGTLGFTIDQPASVPTGAVSADYPLTIPALTPPVKFTMTGHPSGLAIHPTTGVISGKPKVAGTFKVSVTGSTTAGASTTLSFLLTVNPLPVGAVGTYHGPIARESTLNGGLGGRFEMTTTATGSFTGKVILGAVSYSFPPSLLLTTAVGNASPTASFNIQRKAPLPALTVSFTLDSATHLLTGGDITDGTHHASFTAWRKKWGTVMTQPEKDDLNRYVGLHTFALQVPVGQPALPQGSGYGAFTVAANTGALTAAGKLADNTVFTCATFAGPNGEVLIYQALYTSKGSIVGALDIAPGTIGFVPPYGDNTITGTVSWLRPAITGRVYAAGFGPYDLTAVGGRYVPPVAPKLALGITDDLVNDNATLAFSGVTLINASPNIAFRLKAGSVFVPPLVANNSRKTTLKVTPSTGYFTGGFSLSDPNAIVGTAVRSATYYGQIVRDTGGVLRGYGFFLLADSPLSAGQTVKTTLQRSGLVKLEKSP